LKSRINPTTTNVSTYICRVNIEQELNLTTGVGELQKAHLNILFSAGVIYNRATSVLKPYRLTLEQFNVMRILRGSHGKEICVKQIAGRMVDRNSNVSRIIDKLEAKDYVSRIQSKIDKRESTISLTELGLQHINFVSDMVQPLIDSVIKLSESEAYELNQLLDKSR